MKHYLILTAFAVLGTKGFSQEPVSSKKNAGTTSQTTTTQDHTENTKDAVSNKKADATPVKETKDEQPADKAGTQSMKKKPE